MTGQTIHLITPGARKLAHELVDKAPWEAVVNIREATRTGPQNDRMWAMLSDVSRSKPNGKTHTPETWKALFMHALGHEVRFVEGLNGEPFPCGFRSSRLNKSQMADLITFIDQWGTENGVRWSHG